MTPAPGREDIEFVGQTSTGGSADVIVVPVDMLEAIRSGEADPRRYNVSQLLAGGHTDAGAVPESELDSREYAGLFPVEAGASVTASAAAQELTVSVKDRSGGTPEDSIVGWVHAGTGETGEIEIGEDGTGTVALEPGEYMIMTTLFDRSDTTGRSEAVFGFTAATVGEEPTKLEVDAAAAAPVTAEVEREDAVLTDHLLYLETTYESGSFGTFDFLDPDADVFVLPQPETGEFGFNFIYQPVFAGAEDGGVPYTYTLAFPEAGSIPADPAYTVADADLVEEETDFQDLGVELEGMQCDYPIGWEDQFFLFSQCTDRVFPSKATTLLTAESVRWDRHTEGVVLDEQGEFLDGFYTTQQDVAFEPGSAKRAIGDGPLAAGVPYAEREGDRISGGVTPVASHGGEVLRMFDFASGEVTLSRGGELIGTSDSWGEFSFKLPYGDEGRYTLTSEAARGSVATPLAVSATATWEFDSATAELELLDLPVVVVEAAGVQHGWAEGDEPLELELSLSSGEQEAESIGLEVSYDDGATWTEVEVDCGTAELVHPEGAEYASLRLTATDAAGTEVTHTTIRSFGLR
ncbi:hypothetical protein EIW28_07970 [Glycomyces terrestris]|uniref:Uncharacterized protein n=1 Tax=Glycomyces terrestris TaxID=2493553 RepID=A0A426V0R4_9ACTN|nr:hypothetical protein EIW28_07970 [Glycomyces terrestris]